MGTEKIADFPEIGNFKSGMRSQKYSFRLCLVNLLALPGVFR
jgi:hypothetical protein